MLSSKGNKEDTKTIMNALGDEKSDLRLIYVTPEYMAKSKRFMSKLEVAFGQGRLDMFAIDEVHCCSEWGHDFRKDYNYLGILKAMFPGVPILGLTATATAKIIIDVQKMLDIKGCLVLRSSFNRPNLFYEVRRKPADSDACTTMIENLLKNKFKGETGIIYTTTIKESETLTTELRSRGLKVGCYHANLELDFRSKVLNWFIVINVTENKRKDFHQSLSFCQKVYNKWFKGEYQAVIATIAFGLGIDKPDVRFVIHHCVSKSMENFYQESGRAGRDGKKATCIAFFKLADVFKLSTMVFENRTGLQNLYHVLAYCLNPCTCRRSLIANHFEETWTTKDCAQMCDHCSNPKTPKEIDVAPYCRHLYQILSKATEKDARLTFIKLVDAWFDKGPALHRVSTVPTPKFSREFGETIVGHLLVNGYLKEHFHYTAYSTISYMDRGPKSGIAAQSSHKIMFQYVKE